MKHNPAAKALARPEHRQRVVPDKRYAADIRRHADALQDWETEQHLDRHAGEHANELET